MRVSSVWPDAQCLAGKMAGNAQADFDMYQYHFFEPA
jgi:hypothetical protein